MKTFVLPIVLTAQLCAAFRFVPTTHQRMTLKMSDSSTPVSESPLVDRALDSALDFLQDAEGEAEEEVDEYEIFEIFDDAPDLEVPVDLVAELEEKESQTAATKIALSGEIHKQELQEIMKKWAKHEGDVGSSQVQVAIANERVSYLTTHLLANKKDMSAKRGLQALVVLRRKHLQNVYDKDPSFAMNMAEEMGIRFRPTGKFGDKKAKYAAFKNTKSKKAKV